MLSQYVKRIATVTQRRRTIFIDSGFRHFQLIGTNRVFKLRQLISRKKLSNLALSNSNAESNAVPTVGVVGADTYLTKYQQY